MQNNNIQKFDFIKNIIAAILFVLFFAGVIIDSLGVFFGIISNESMLRVSIIMLLIIIFFIFVKPE